MFLYALVHLCVTSVYTYYDVHTVLYILFAFIVLVWAELALTLPLMQCCRDYRKEMISMFMILWYR